MTTADAPVCRSRDAASRKYLKQWFVSRHQKKSSFAPASRKSPGRDSRCGGRFALSTLARRGAPPSPALAIVRLPESKSQVQVKDVGHAERSRREFRPHIRHARPSFLTETACPT